MKRQDLLKMVESRPELGGRNTLAAVERKLAAIEEILARITEFRAADMMKLRQPLDTMGFSLAEAEASIAISDMMKK